MALFMYQAAYTAESVAAQIKEPHDRIEAVRPAIENLGGKLIAGGYPFGERLLKKGIGRDWFEGGRIAAKMASRH